MEVRLQKFMADCGVASRRAAEVMIQEGRVMVNDRVVTEMGIKIKPKDRVKVDGKPIRPAKEKVYALLFKPIGVVCTAKDPEGRKTVVDLVDVPGVRLFPVGRLDYDTSGLIILTNDGDFALKMTHPSHEIWKTYEVQVEGSVKPEQLAKLMEGVDLDGEMTAPALVQELPAVAKGDVIEIRIREGRNRQVRRMFEALGLNILRLKRSAIGSLRAPDLRGGTWRLLSQPEVDKLLSECEGRKKLKEKENPIPAQAAPKEKKRARPKLKLGKI